VYYYNSVFIVIYLLYLCYILVSLLHLCVFPCYIYTFISFSKQYGSNNKRKLSCSLSFPLFLYFKKRSSFFLEGFNCTYFLIQNFSTSWFLFPKESYGYIDHSPVGKVFIHSLLACTYFSGDDLHMLPFSRLEGKENYLCRTYLFEFIFS
jgi:hypothetical protein